MTENFHHEFEKQHLKNTKRFMKGQFCLLVFNICWAILELTLGLKSYSPIQLACVGMMCMNAIWSLVFLLDGYSDYKQSKRMVNYYEEQEADGNYDRLVQSLNYMKNYYEKKLTEIGEKLSDDKKVES